MGSGAGLGYADVEGRDGWEGGERDGGGEGEADGDVVLGWGVDDGGGGQGFAEGYGGRGEEVGWEAFLVSFGNLAYAGAD